MGRVCGSGGMISPRFAPKLAPKRSSPDLRLSLPVPRCQGWAVARSGVAWATRPLIRRACWPTQLRLQSFAATRSVGSHLHGPKRVVVRELAELVMSF